MTLEEQARKNRAAEINKLIDDEIEQLKLSAVMDAAIPRVPKRWQSNRNHHTFRHHVGSDPDDEVVVIAMVDNRPVAAFAPNFYAGRTRYRIRPPVQNFINKLQKICDEVHARNYGYNVPQVTQRFPSYQIGPDFSRSLKYKIVVADACCKGHLIKGRER